MIENKSVVLDVDGVLLDLIPPAVKHFNRRFGTTIEPCNVTRYGFLHEKAREYGLSELSNDEITSIVYSSEIAAEARPTPGAQKFVKKLHDLGFNIVTATARSESMRSVTIDSLDKYFPGLITRLYARKPGQLKTRPKHVAILAHKPIAFIEDDPENLLWMLKKEGLSPKYVLIHQLWNMHVSEIKREGTQIKRFGFCSEHDWNDRDHEWEKITNWIMV